MPAEEKDKAEEKAGRMGAVAEREEVAAVMVADVIRTDKSNLLFCRYFQCGRSQKVNRVQFSFLGISSSSYDEG